MKAKHVGFLIIFLILSQFAFNTKPAMLANIDSQLMVATEEIQLQSVEFDISQMGVLPAGAIVKVWCLDNSCLMDDFTTFMRRDQLKEYNLLISNRWG